MTTRFDHNRVVPWDERVRNAEMARMCVAEAGHPELVPHIRPAPDRRASEMPGVAIIFHNGIHQKHKGLLDKARAVRNMTLNGPEYQTVCSDHTGFPDERALCRYVRVADLLLGYTCSQRPCWDESTQGGMQ